MFRRKFLNARQRIIIAGANVNAAGGKTGCRFSCGDEGDFKTASGENMLPLSGRPHPLR